MRIKADGLLTFKGYRRRILFIVFLFASGALIIDNFISSGADTLRDFASSFVGILLFSVVNLICIICGYVMLIIFKDKLKQSNAQNNFSMTLLMRSLTVIFCVLVFLILFITLQIHAYNHYYIFLMSAVVAIGYGFTSIIMSVLAFKLLNWFRTSKSLIVIVYSFAAISFVINAVISLALFEQLLIEKPLTFSLNSAVEFNFTCQPGSLKCFLVNFQSYTLSAYFFTMWIGSVILLSHNIRRLGKLLFCILVVLPLIAFYLSFISAYNELYQIGYALSKANTNMVMMSLIIFFGISCGILYGLGFKSISQHIKSSINVKDFMKLSAYGIILYFISANSTVAAAGYPPFGIASMLFVPLSSFAILLGVYYSAIAVAHDYKLRNEVKTSLLKGKFLDQIGNAEHLKNVEETILKLTKDKAYKIIELSNVEPSISENELRDYLKNILSEKLSEDRS